MKLRVRHPGSSAHSRELAYMLVEAMIYVGLLFVLLGIGYTAVYRCIDRSVALRRNAADLGSALQSGERWRADVRAARGNIRLDAPGQLLRLPGPRGEVQYRWGDGAISRRIGEGQWVTVLTNVVAAGMESSRRHGVTAWRWDLELRSHSKLSRIKPLFTFIAAAAPESTP